MTRSELRRKIFKIVFRAEFHSMEEMEDQIAMRLAQLREGGVKEADLTYIGDKSKAILASLEELDAAIATHSRGWRVERLGKTELAILRVAVYEILKDDDIPRSVAINEAVELAKLYSSDEAPRFINGILAKLA